MDGTGLHDIDFGVTTPWKINMDHNDGGLEDHFPFLMGDL